VKSIKVRVMSKKRSSIFQEKINSGDTAELTDRQTVMTKNVVSFFSEKIGVIPFVAAPVTPILVTPLGRSSLSESLRA